MPAHRTPTLASVALTASLLLTACTAEVTASGGTDVAPGDVDVTALDEHRTPYVGDNSEVAALVGALGLDAVGERTLALATGERPYAVTIEFSSLAEDLPAADADALLADRAALLLATVDNADEVRWAHPEGTGVVTRADADTAAGGPVAELGADAEGLRDLLDRLEG